MKTQEEQRQITTNTEAVKDVAQRNAQLSKMIDVSLHNISEDVRTVKAILTEGKSCLNMILLCNHFMNFRRCLSGGFPEKYFCPKRGEMIHQDGI